jgi:hypothetical protein
VMIVMIMMMLRNFGRCDDECYYQYKQD